MSKLKLQEYSRETSSLKPIYEAISAEPMSKRLKLEGTAIVCDEPGINGRTYTSRLMGREANKYTNNYIKIANSLGELNHPPVDEEGNARHLPVTEINLEKVCHIIEKLEMQGNKMIIKSRVIEKHPCGAIVKVLVDDGIPVGNSLRGLGSVYREGGSNFVADDYELITIDVVGRPSYGNNAMLHSLVEAVNSHKIPLLTEAVEYAVKEFRSEIDSAVRSNTLKQTSYYSLNKLLESLGK